MHMYLKIIKNNRVAISSTISRLNLNLEMLAFVGTGKPECPEKNPQSRDKNQQQTQPTYVARSGNLTRATLVGGECSHHFTIPPHPNLSRKLCMYRFAQFENSWFNYIFSSGKNLI